MVVQPGRLHCGLGLAEGAPALRARCNGRGGHRLARAGSVGVAGRDADPIAADYPRVEDGARGVRFIEKTVESAGSDRKWTSMA